MIIPDVKHPKWKEAVTSTKDYDFQFLATKILLGRLRLNCKHATSPHEIDSAVHELRSFFVTNVNIPMTTKDMNEIIGETKL